ncbi:hypothetical protein JVU11DRAFT_7025 [Chiua virens]|nr:hypothetical protein JVU11DRAFT_7025 [Chiua virens]
MFMSTKHTTFSQLDCPITRHTPIQILSATLPDRVLAAIKQQFAISPDVLELQLSTNHPNIIFDVAEFMDANLPHGLENHGVVKHYHSTMSVEYLQQTFEDFSNPNGTCRILHAMAGAATVVFRSSFTRDSDSTGLFLAVVKTWALELDLRGAVGGASNTDRDKPYVRLVKANSLKPDRTSIASLQFVQFKTCLREFFAKYLGDNLPEASQFTAQWCCDRHDGSSFNLSALFHYDPLTTSNEHKINFTPCKERKELLKQLEEWREKAHQDDLFYLITWIINDDALKLVSKMHPTKLQSLDDLVKLLGETQDWSKRFGEKLFDDVIAEFKPTEQPSGPSKSNTCERLAKQQQVKDAQATAGMGTFSFKFMTIATPESFST